MSYKVLARVSAVVAVLVLAACQTTTIGGDAGGKWKNIGQSANQNVRHELDTASVKRVGDVVTYRDRKVLKDPMAEATPNLPVFTTATNTYQMQCKDKTYRITATELRNAKGEVVYQQNFGTQVPVQRVTTGSPAQKQFDTVCS